MLYLLWAIFGCGTEYLLQQGSQREHSGSLTRFMSDACSGFHNNLGKLNQPADSSAFCLIFTQTFWIQLKSCLASLSLAALQITLGLMLYCLSFHRQALIIDQFLTFHIIFYSFQLHPHSISIIMGQIYNQITQNYPIYNDTRSQTSTHTRMATNYRYYYSNIITNGIGVDLSHLGSYHITRWD